MLQKFNKSLTHSTLLSMGIRISLVVMITAVLSYLHTVGHLEELTLDKLEKYITERAHKESAIFNLAQDNHTIFKQAFLELWPKRKAAETKTRFEQMFEAQQDGTLRLTQQAFTGISRPHHSVSDYLGESRWISGFVGLGTPINEVEFQNRLLLSYDLVDHFAEGWSNRFANTYVSLPEGVNIVYWPDLNWSEGASSDLDIPNEEWVYIANKQHNPERKSVWTGLYYDQTADQWMVSCETPVDDPDGRHLINVGHDILLNKVFERVFNDHLDGAYNYIVRDDGRLIAHPLHTDDLRLSKGVLNVDQLTNSPVSTQYKNIIASINVHGNKTHIINDEKSDAFLAVAPIDGPNWYFVTVYPKSLLSGPAIETAWFIFMLGTVSLIVELIMLYLVLIKRVLSPMKRFEMASDSITAEQYDLHPILKETAEQRKDEVGKLAGAMMTMADHIYTHNLDLENQINQRTQELEQAKQIAELQARTDPLTGLPNRRAFFEVGSYAFQNAKRNREHLSLLMLDIDRFKSINDTYGHAIGDVVLKELAETLINLLRPSDLCARIGGEEFAILMPSTDLKGAVNVAEKIRLHIKMINVTAIDTSFNFTASFGVADISSDHFQLEALLRDADIALYDAKGEGRDRVVSYR